MIKEDISVFSRRVPHYRSGRFRMPFYDTNATSAAIMLSMLEITYYF